jgi:hypothetical protein
VVQYLGLGALVPKLPDLAMDVAKIAVRGFWLTGAMKSAFIATEGPIQVVNPRTGAIVNMTAEPVGLSAAIVAGQTLALFGARLLDILFSLSATPLPRRG